MRFLTTVMIFMGLLIGHGQAKKTEKAEEVKKDDKMTTATFNSLSFRALGPALTSGRIVDIAVNPVNHSEFYIAVGSGGVWKTTNRGISFDPIFEGESRYSIGCITIDPNNPYTVWVGSGENNSQRSVAYGDGIYKSLDAGKSWKNMGLKNSEHIGKIVIDPRNSNVIYVAAQGPLWAPGGDRGLYKSTDGGETWEQSLKVSEHTGVSDIAIDPRNPDVIYCSSYQRERHVYTMIDGGPEAAVYKTTDAGKTWNKLTNGLPSGDVGRIGIAVSPVNPDMVFATIEGRDETGGFYASTNRGASWTKRNKWFSGAAQYYQELFCDPKDENIIVNLDTYTQISFDGGYTFRNLGNKHRHVDDHAIWIDPSDNKHIMIGCDGGLYETYDRADNWRFFPNIPVTQDYRVGIDNAEPFYNVYFGTQDNNSWGGPSRTTNSGGITNEDWYLVVGGDGYQARVDPTNPNIVYGQWQYGNLVRYDKKSGEVFYIQPQPEKGEELRWNWDTPLILSNHSPTRIYIAANRLFKSDNRGNTWKAISPDLTRQIDRNKLPIMGKIWGPDAVNKSGSTSLYGNIVALTESPKNENIVIVGTDDGLIQITDDGGKNWTKIEKVGEVPETTYVSDVFASQFDENTIYATFNNMKNADFKPYVYVSKDKGKSWKSISSNLPENGGAWTIYEDYVNPNLLFVGTEFGVFFSVDAGEKWIQLKGGLPTIAVKDIEIQKRENDLVLATFGRGIYILDNYGPLRDIKSEVFDKTCTIFPVKDALMFNEDDSKSKGDQGETFWRAKNPEYGATFTYYIKDKIQTKKQIRKEEEAKLEKDNKPITNYPTLADLKAEDEEEAPYIFFNIMDSDGNIIRTLKTGASDGLHRFNWDLRYANLSPVSEHLDINKFSSTSVMPGKYKVQIGKSVNGEMTILSEPVEFNVRTLNNVTLPAENRKALVDFQKKVSKLQRAILGTNRLLGETQKNVETMRNALLVTENAKKEQIMKTSEILRKLKAIETKLEGDRTAAERNDNQTPSINDRLNYIIDGVWGCSSEPTDTQKDAYKIASEDFKPLLDNLKQIINVDIKELTNSLDKLGSPWIPGTIPSFEEK